MTTQTQTQTEKPTNQPEIVSETYIKITRRDGVLYRETWERQTFGTLESNIMLKIEKANDIDPMFRGF